MEFQSLVSYVYTTKNKRGKVSPQSEIKTGTFILNPFHITGELLQSMAMELAPIVKENDGVEAHMITILSISPIVVYPERKAPHEDQATVEEAIEEKVEDKKKK